MNGLHYWLQLMRSKSPNILSNIHKNSQVNIDIRLTLYDFIIRKELRDKYSSQGKAKIEKDYERTKVDFYRMELHKLKDVHPVNRDNMKKAYYAYLQNTPGSKKAVKECVKEVTGEKSEKEDQEKAAEEEEETEHRESGEEQHQNNGGDDGEREEDDH